MSVEWHPQETAPKDQPILVWTKTGPLVVEWDSHVLDGVDRGFYHPPFDYDGEWDGQFSAWAAITAP